jgi:hypothetical protein
MATLHSTRRKAESGARRGKRHEVQVAAVRRRSGAAPRRRSVNPPSGSTSTAWTPALLAQLRDIVLRLELIYSTCVTAQLALEGQNSEQDHDIARCLRLGVSESAATQLERIEAIIADVDGATRKPAS